MSDRLRRIRNLGQFDSANGAAISSLARRALVENRRFASLAQLDPTLLIPADGFEECARPNCLRSLGELGAAERKVANEEGR